MASYKIVKIMLYTTVHPYNGMHKTLLYTVHPVSMGFGALLKESIQTTCRRCRQRNHPFDNSRFDVVTKDTVPTHLRPCSSPLLVGNVDGIIIPGHRRMLDGRMSTVAGCSTHQHRCNQMFFYYSCFDRSRRFFHGGVTVISKARCDEATAQLNCPAQPSLTTVNSSRTPIDRWVLGGPVEDDAGVDRTCLRMRCEKKRVFSHTNW